MYRCVRDGTVSLSTAPEPGSKCTAKHIDDDAAKLPNLWGELGVIHGTLYERQQDGKTVYGTRKLPGSTVVTRFTVATPPGSSAHAGLGQVGKPRMDLYPAEFRAAAKANKVDRSLRPARIPHAPRAVTTPATSPGRAGRDVMPAVARENGVADPFASSQSIRAGAKLLARLVARCHGDYSGGRGLQRGHRRGGEVRRCRRTGETLEYVDKGDQAVSRYRAAMGLKPLRGWG